MSISTVQVSWATTGQHLTTAQSGSPDPANLGPALAADEGTAVSGVDA